MGIGTARRLPAATATSAPAKAAKATLCSGALLITLSSAISSIAAANLFFAAASSSFLGIFRLTAVCRAATVVRLRLFDQKGAGRT